MCQSWSLPRHASMYAGLLVFCGALLHYYHAINTREAEQTDSNQTVYCGKLTRTGRNYPRQRTYKDLNRNIVLLKINSILTPKDVIFCLFV